ncbi:hypothetical protein EJ08DRAFT_702346 [Tothia fuscella]|uniref:Uncharacterized protein n=1 Tax=Tothia fuscella TaxID=1048955 RepID=A0A9P4NGV0_9PEZI|nr:hypothetical protein EJ08DRAFT_702346 [Tothia fuscella]
MKFLTLTTAAAALSGMAFARNIPVTRALTQRATPTATNDATTTSRHYMRLGHPCGTSEPTAPAYVEKRDQRDPEKSVNEACDFRGMFAKIRKFIDDVRANPKRYERIEKENFASATQIQKMDPDYVPLREMIEYIVYKTFAGGSVGGPKNYSRRDDSATLKAKFREQFERLQPEGLFGGPGSDFEAQFKALRTRYSNLLGLFRFGKLGTDEEFGKYLDKMKGKSAEEVKQDFREMRVMEFLGPYKKATAKRTPTSEDLMKDIDDHRMPPKDDEIMHAATDGLRPPPEETKDASKQKSKACAKAEREFLYWKNGPGYESPLQVIPISEGQDLFPSEDNGKWTRPEDDDLFNPPTHAFDDMVLPTDKEMEIFYPNHVKSIYHQQDEALKEGFRKVYEVMGWPGRLDDEFPRVRNVLGEKVAVSLIKTIREMKDYGEAAKYFVKWKVFADLDPPHWKEKPLAFDNLEVPKDAALMARFQKVFEVMGWEGKLEEEFPKIKAVLGEKVVVSLIETIRDTEKESEKVKYFLKWKEAFAEIEPPKEPK